MSTRLDVIVSLLLKSNRLRINSTLTELDPTHPDLIQTELTRHDKINPIMLWHERMGHIGEKGIQAMHNKGMVEGFLECGLEVYFCEH
jgi:hypothetical protein